MINNTLKSLAESAILVGGLVSFTLCPNTSSVVYQIEKPNYSYTQKVNTTSDSALLTSYMVPSEKFDIEETADELFGKMRMATNEEQKAINDYLESVSTPLGVNFWDLC